MIKKIDSIKDWNLIFNDKNSKSEIIILKTSHRCSISMFAKRQFNKWADNLTDDNSLNIYEIDVIFQRNISNQIAGDTRITHQSPQVIWLDKDRSVKCHLNHGSINGRNLTKYYEGNHLSTQVFFSKYFN